MSTLSPRVRFLEVLSNIFDFRRGQTARGVLLFACAAVSVGVLINGLFGVVAALGQCLLYPIHWTRTKDPLSLLLAAVDQMPGPLFLAGIVLIFAWLNYESNIQRSALHLVPPSPHAGLILMLGPFNARKGCPFQSSQDVESAAAAGPLETLRAGLLASNWGPLVVALEHHGNLAHHCWIVCTQGGSAPQFDVAARVLRRFSKATFHQASIPDPNDVTVMVPVIDAIYKEALAYNLRAEQVIADFTGGTAAMSGGMILATLREDRQLEYLRQDVPLDQALVSIQVSADLAKMPGEEHENPSKPNSARAGRS
jgi:hypothetical protein